MQHTDSPAIKNGEGIGISFRSSPSHTNSRSEGLSFNKRQLKQRVLFGKAEAPEIEEVSTSFGGLNVHAPVGEWQQEPPSSARGDLRSCENDSAVGLHGMGIDPENESVPADEASVAQR